jgi:hypothetical protein
MGALRVGSPPRCNARASCGDCPSRGTFSSTRSVADRRHGIPERGRARNNAPARFWCVAHTWLDVRHADPKFTVGFNVRTTAKDCSLPSGGGPQGTSPIGVLAGTTVGKT